MNHTCILGNGDKSTAQTADMGRSHNAAFFNSVIKKCKCSGCTVASAHFKSHLLKNICNTVTNSRCRGKWKVNNTKGNTKSLACFSCNKLSHTGDFECSFLNHICNFRDVFSCTVFCKSGSYNAGTRYTDIDNSIGFTDTVESTCHKRVVFGSVTEYNELCGTDAISVGCNFCSLLNDLTHHLNSIHIDAGFCRTDIYGWTNEIGFAQGLWNTLDKSVVTACKTLLNKSGITADEIYTEFLCGFVKSVGKLDNILALARSGYHTDRGNWNSFMYNRNTIFLLDVFTCFNKVFCISTDFVINLCASLINVLVNAVKQWNTHCNCSYIKVFIVYHIYGFKYISCF